jgi:hypothetical protein
VEKGDGIRIACLIEEMKSFTLTVAGETASHSEQVFKIRLNPVLEFMPTGPSIPRPQTIASAKVKHLSCA